MTDQPKPHPDAALTLQTIAMPCDTNPSGDIFGGWVLSQMDLAGGVLAHERARGRVATVAVHGMSFLAPVRVGDVVSCYVALEAAGRTSMKIRIETYARRRDGGPVVKVTEGLFTYVAIDTDGRPRLLPG
jgi:acyl-CoA thioesterase YciA